MTLAFTDSTSLGPSSACSMAVKEAYSQRSDVEMLKASVDVNDVVYLQGHSSPLILLQSAYKICKRKNIHLLYIPVAHLSSAITISALSLSVMSAVTLSHYLWGSQWHHNPPLYWAPRRWQWHAAISITCTLMSRSRHWNNPTAATFEWPVIITFCTQFTLQE